MPRHLPKKPVKKVKCVSAVTGDVLVAERRGRLSNGRSRLAGKQGREEFLGILERCGGVVKYAVEEFGTTVRTAYKYRRENPLFAEDWEKAVKGGTAVLESCAAERALEGSDALLMFLLKARKPDVYRERYDFRHSGSIKSGASDYTESELETIAKRGSDGTADTTPGTPELPGLH